MLGRSDSGVPFSLATLRHGSRAVPVIEREGRYWSLTSVASHLLEPRADAGLMGQFRNWPQSLQELKEIAWQLDALAPSLELKPHKPIFLTPLQYPAKVVLTGTNYQDHVQHVGHLGFNKQDNFPAFFLKPPTTSLVGPGETVHYPEQSNRLDWEIELAVVISRTARRIRAKDALSYVAGCTIGIDLTARDIQNNPRHYVKKDLCLGKAFDDSCPLGPRIVPLDFVGDIQSLNLRLSVNGAVEQEGNTRQMIWSVAEQIEEITKHITLEPGDVLMTGTPAGCGVEKGRFLKIGDVVRAEIETLGELEVTVMPSSIEARHVHNLD